MTQESELMREYRTLEQRLIELRKSTGGLYSSDEAAITDHMVAVWERLSEEEQDMVYNEGEKVPETPSEQPFADLRGGEIMGCFPEFFQEALLPPTQTPMSFGLSCGEGWWNIIEILCEQLRLVKADVQFTQVKNKFGSLCIYYRSTTPELTVSPIQQATKKAAVTCEHCGAPGSKTLGDGWWSVLCPWHEVQVLRREIQRLYEHLDALTGEEE